MNEKAVQDSLDSYYGLVDIAFGIELERGDDYDGEPTDFCKACQNHFICETFGNNRCGDDGCRSTLYISLCHAAADLLSLVVYYRKQINNQGNTLDGGKENDVCVREVQNQ